jgi:hypothetical protein
MVGQFGTGHPGHDQVGHDIHLGRPSGEVADQALAEREKPTGKAGGVHDPAGQHE